MALMAAAIVGTISVHLAQPAHAKGGTFATGGVGSSGSASASIADPSIQQKPPSFFFYKI